MHLACIWHSFCVFFYSLKKKFQFILLFFHVLSPRSYHLQFLEINFKVKLTPTHQPHWTFPLCLAANHCSLFFLIFLVTFSSTWAPSSSFTASSCPSSFASSDFYFFCWNVSLILCLSVPANFCLYSRGFSTFWNFFSKVSASSSPTFSRLKGFLLNSRQLNFYFRFIWQLILYVSVL